MSVGSGTVDLAAYGVWTNSPPLQDDRKSPARSIGSSSPTGGMSKELRFRLEMKKLEMEERRLKAEKEEKAEVRRLEAQELRRFELEKEAELRRERELRVGGWSMRRRRLIRTGYLS